MDSRGSKFDVLRNLFAVIIVALFPIIFVSPASAVPAFAQQVGQPCSSCHVGGFGPQLTSFGRSFKLGGYTMRSGKVNIPLSGMVVTSFTREPSGDPAPPGGSPPKRSRVNFEQASIFLAGGIGSHLGGFIQTTYDGIAKAWSWDNVDLRAVGTGQVGGKSLVYGLSLNNSPTTQDVWNTLPAWGFPYTSSPTAPGPAASPLLAGGLAQNVLGLTGYVWLDSKFYLEGGGYSTPKAGTLRWLGADPLDPGDIHGLAPYGRVAFQQEVAGGTFEIGAFALKAALFPGRDRSSGRTDRYTDLGLDGSWIKPAGKDTITINARYTHEKRRLEATCSLGIADGSIGAATVAQCSPATLNDFRADASYYWHNKIGLTISGFDLSGSRNSFLYPDNRVAGPGSRGLLLQLDGTLFGDGKSPLGPRVNIRAGIQYTAFTRFNGARRNFDGLGTNASDNNALRVFTWLAF